MSERNPKTYPCDDAKITDENKEVLKSALAGKMCDMMTGKEKPQMDNNILKAVDSPKSNS